MTIFHYEDRDTHLDASDPRIKLACLALFSVSTFAVGAPGLVILTCALLLGYRAARRSLFRPLRDAALFILFVLLAGLSQILSGRASSTAVAGAGLFVFRMLLALMLSNLFVATTSVSKMRDSVTWCASWLPGSTAERLGVLFMVTIALVPMLLDCPAAVREALRARGFHSRRHPLRTVRLLGANLLRSGFDRATTLAFAIESRGGTEHSRRAARAIHSDTTSTVAVGLGCAVAIVLAALTRLPVFH